MANYATLKAAIAAAIRENGNNEITGNLLQQQLLAMVNSLGAGYQFMGVATPSTNPGTPDQNVFYIASEAGTYSNFSGIVVAENEVAILKWNGVWAKETTGAATAAQLNQLGQVLNDKIIDSTSAQTYINEYDHSLIIKRQLGYLDSSGNVGYYSNYGRTQKIKVSPGDILTFHLGINSGGSARHCIFDSSDSLIQAFSDESSPYTVPENASYIVFSINNIYDRDYFVKLHRAGNTETRIEADENTIRQIQSDVLSIANSIESVSYSPLNYDHYLNGYYMSNGTFVQDSHYTLYGYKVTAGDHIRFAGVVNGPSGSDYGAIVFTKTQGGNGTIIVSTARVGENIDLRLIAPEDGYYYYWDYDGSYNVYSGVVLGTKFDYLRSLFVGNNIAILGDSIMMLMGAHTGTNNVTFEDQQGNQYSYSQLTNTNGHLTAPNSEPVDVVNSDQSGLDAQKWDALKEKIGANKLYNFGLGGAVLQERTIITSYPYPDGDNRTTCLPNEVRWLIRRYDAGDIEQPNCIVIWLGTNSINSPVNNYETIMALTYSELDSDSHYSDRCTVFGGLRWSLETLYRKFTSATIICVTPIQANPASRDYNGLNIIGEAIKKMASRYSCIACDALNEIGIPEALYSVYLADGLHPNAKGKNVLTEYLAKKIANNYFDK